MLTALLELSRKYRELLTLRQRREEAEATGVPFGPDELAARRAAFKALAADFPGALRELDESTAVTLADKSRALEEEVAAVRAGGAVGRRWVLVVIDFHTTLRRLLSRKAELGRGMQNAPGGRLLPLVWTELEARHGGTREELREMVFGRQG